MAAAYRTSALYFLTNYPAVYDKLCAEVRQAFPTTENLNFNTVGGLQYLDAVIHECWRVYPPAISSSPRIVPGKGAFIQGRWVPGDVSL